MPFKLETISQSPFCIVSKEKRREVREVCGYFW